MKGLILREFWLSKKSMLMTLGIGLIFFVLGILILLSGRYGNLAKYTDPEELKHMMESIQSYVPVMAFIMFFVGAGDAINATVYSDQECGWHKFIRASEVRIRTYVGAKYLSLLLSRLISVLILLVILPLFMLAGGKADPGASAIMAAFSGFMLLYFDYMIPVAFLVKKREKGIIAAIIPMIPLIIAPVTIVIFIDMRPEIQERLAGILNSGSLNKWGYIVFAAALLLMYVSYRLSVRIVSREG